MNISNKIIWSSLFFVGICTGQCRAADAKVESLAQQLKNQEAKVLALKEEKCGKSPRETCHFLDDIDMDLKELRGQITDIPKTDLTENPRPTEAKLQESLNRIARKLNALSTGKKSDASKTGPTIADK